jgi:hypothetical protein
VQELLQNVLFVIDPCMNPDGRERILTQVRQGTGHTANLDYDSMQRGRWPWGRGNHYLFDMNRDWMAGTQPETRGRWRLGLRFRPLLFVDAHEMGSLDTYLFYPQSAPQNPYLPATLAGWQKVFGLDQARAFDAHGWGYYTREWADAWAPFYSDAWGSLNGAVGMLYEQASTQGVALRRTSGRVLTYREAVHHHAVSSLANVTTLAKHRTEMLRDYLAGRRRNVAADTPGNDRMFVIVPSGNRTREDAFVAALLGQGIEVLRTTAPFTAREVDDSLGRRHETLEVPAGALVVSVRQPQSPLVKSYLTFDVRIDPDTLRDERRELEIKAQSKMYDATAWSLPLQYALDAYACPAMDVPGTRVNDIAPVDGIVNADPQVPTTAVAWVVDGADDACLRFAARALERGLVVHAATLPFHTGGRPFARGSLLIRAGENGADVARQVDQVAREARVAVYATASGRSGDDGPDLGGQRFQLLARPRVALVGNAPISPDAYGSLWHYLDVDLGLPVSSLDAQSFGSYDLRRYNVLILPPGDTGDLVSSQAERLRSWMDGGGTLIACGSSAAAVAEPKADLTTARLRQDILDHLADYEFAARRELAARTIEIDERTIWGPATHPLPGESPESKAKPETKGDPDAKREDQWLRRFMPGGVFLRGLVDCQHWLTAGCRDEMPMFVSGSSSFYARSPVQTPIRLAAADDLRLSGLVWQEARERLAHSAQVMVERKGNGQVILLAGQPTYRGSMRGTARVLGNAALYGPGLGASQPSGW